MKRSWLAVRAAGVLLVFAGGCAVIAGLDNKYEQESASPSGGAAGGGPCMTREDCPADSDCSAWACSGGSCVLSVAPDGAPVATGAVQGDCKKNVCQGGKPAVLPDDTDLVEDNNPCTMEMCNGGVKLSSPAPDGTACGSTGKLACVNGLCEGCNTDPSACDPPTGCQVVACPVNSCVYTIEEGKVLDDVSEMDCKKDVCDAQGNKATVGDTTETPPQTGDDCKVETCAADGSIAEMNANDGVKCASSSELCYADSVCQSGACSPQPAPAGTKVSDNGTAGDCKALVCDGMGGMAEGIDDTDAPADPTPGDCTGPACLNGVVEPSAPKSKGDACTSQPSGKCCGTKCCGNAVGDFCTSNNSCCATGKACGFTCCKSATDNCFGANACCSGSVCGGGSSCCATLHACEPGTNKCCPQAQRCPNGTKCCPSGQTCSAGNVCQ